MSGTEPLWKSVTNFLQQQIYALKRQIGELAATISSGITQLTGDVTAGPGSGSVVATISNDAVTDAKLANMPQATFKGRAAGAGTGDPQNLTANQASTILDGATDPFLRTSAAAAGYTDEQAQDAVGAMIDSTLEYVDATPLLRRAALTGDVTAAAGSNATTIANDAVTPAKLDNGGACSVLGRSANSTGDRADISAGANNRFLARKSNALSWEQVDLASGDVTGLLPLSNLAARTARDAITFDGNGADIPANTRIAFSIPVAATLIRWRIMNDAAGSITYDIWSDTYANYDPTVADTIIGGGGTKPTTSSAKKNEATTLTGFTTSFSAGQTFIVNVDSCTGVKWSTLELWWSY